MEVGRSAQANPYLERLVKKDDLCRMFVIAFLGNMLEVLYCKVAGLYSKECVHSFCYYSIIHFKDISNFLVSFKFDFFCYIKNVSSLRLAS